MFVFLTLDGLEVLVATSGAAERPPELRGEVAPALDGSLLSSASPARRSFALTTAPLTDAEDRALRLRVGGGRLVTAGGRLIEGKYGLAVGGTVEVVVQLGEAAMTPTDGPDGPEPRHTLALVLLAVAASAAGA